MNEVGKVPADPTNQAMILPDGRVLAYAEYGDLAGRPLFFFHGGNDSRLEAAILHETAVRMGIRVIAPDRPGYGRSDFQPERTFLNWPDDVAQLADALSIPQFAVVGHSGGGPHAAAVAYAPARTVNRRGARQQCRSAGKQQQGHASALSRDELLHGTFRPAASSIDAANSQPG